MIPPFAVKYGAIGLAVITLVGSAYIKGRSDAHEKCLRADIRSANEAVEADRADRENQRQAGELDALALAGEIARLRRQIVQRNDSNVEDGRTCFDSADGVELLDDYDEIFEAGLRP